MSTSGKILIFALCLIIIALAAFIVYNKIGTSKEVIQNSEASLSGDKIANAKTNSEEPLTENETTINSSEKFS